LPPNANKYVPPGLRNSEQSRRPPTFGNVGFVGSGRRMMLKTNPNYKENPDDFPTLGEDGFNKLGLSKEGTSMPISYAGLVNKSEKLEKKTPQVNIEDVKPGWIRWRRDENTNKYIMECGFVTKDFNRFNSWLNDYKDDILDLKYYKFMDLLEERENIDLEINGPKYKNSWDPPPEPEYDSDFTPESDSESEEHEYVEDY